MNAGNRNRRAIDWPAIRAQHEAGGKGSSFRALATRHGVSHVAISKRATKEGWTQDLEPTIHRKVTAAVAGAVTGGNPQKRAEAIDAEASRRAAVIARHRAEWDSARERLVAGLSAHRAARDREAKALAFDDLKAAKIASEILTLVQSGERRAWSLDAPTVPDPRAPLRVEVVEIDESLNSGGDDE